MGDAYIGYGSIFSIPVISDDDDNKLTVDFTSFPHTSQPGVVCRANNSTRGKAPIRVTIFSRASSGFLLCPSTGETMS